jgi:hypothetical protein
VFATCRAVAIQPTQLVGELTCTVAATWATNVDSAGIGCTYKVTTFVTPILQGHNFQLVDTVSQSVEMAEKGTFAVKVRNLTFVPPLDFGNQSLQFIVAPFLHAVL